VKSMGCLVVESVDCSVVESILICQQSCSRAELKQVTVIALTDEYGLHNPAIHRVAG
jgi:hypothetical protein